MYNETECGNRDDSYHMVWIWRIHPYAPQDQALGYAQLFDDLELWLADITGFDAISLQPNAGLRENMQVF